MCSCIGWVCSSVLWLLCVVFLGVFNIFRACSTFFAPSSPPGPPTPRTAHPQDRPPPGPPSPGPPSPGPPSPGPPKISLFFPSPATFFFLSSLSWGSFRGILVVFLKAGTLKCAFEAPAFKHHQNSTRRPRREGRQEENCGGEGKNAKFWAPHPSGPHFFWVRGPTLWGPLHPSRTLRGSIFLGSEPHPSGPHHSLPHPPRQFGQLRSGQIRLNKLTKYGQIRFGQVRSRPSCQLSKAKLKAAPTSATPSL